MPAGNSGKEVVATWGQYQSTDLISNTYELKLSDGQRREKPSTLAGLHPPFPTFQSRMCLQQAAHGEVDTVGTKRPKSRPSFVTGDCAPGLGIPRQKYPG